MVKVAGTRSSDLHAGKTHVIQEVRPLDTINDAIPDVETGRVAARVVFAPYAPRSVVLRSDTRSQPRWEANPAGVRSWPMAAIFNLNHHASYVHWHFFQMSVSNILLIVAMLVVFALAILLPFPRGATAGKHDERH